MPDIILGTSKAVLVARATASPSLVRAQALMAVAASELDPIDAESVIVTATSYSRIRDVAANVAEALKRQPHDEHVMVGLGGPIEPSRSVGESSREARRAVDVAQAASIAGPVVAYEDVMMIEAIASDAALRARLVRVLEPIISYDRRKGGKLLRTLEHYLDADFSAASTARALGIHRHTFDYRLGKIEQLLNRSMAHFPDRFLIESAVLARRLQVRSISLAHDLDDRETLPRLGARRP